MDGVLTTTADLHFRAWASLFADVKLSPVFSRQDYETLVDGRPRRDGLMAVLRDRDQLDELDIEAMAARKQELFLALLDDVGVQPFPDVIPCLRRLERAGISFAAASSSRNAGRVLQSSHLNSHFAVLVDGIASDELGLPGKPAPDLFLRAAALIGVEPGECALVEDATSGVAAGVAGGFAVVVGLDRTGQNRGLVEHADVVMQDLTALPAAISTTAQAATAERPDVERGAAPATTDR